MHRMGIEMCALPSRLILLRRATIHVRPRGYVQDLNCAALKYRDYICQVKTLARDSTHNDITTWNTYVHLCTPYWQAG